MKKSTKHWHFVVAFLLAAAGYFMHDWHLLAWAAIDAVIGVGLSIENKQFVSDIETVEK